MIPASEFLNNNKKEKNDNQNVNNKKGDFFYDTIVRRSFHAITGLRNFMKKMRDLIKNLVWHSNNFLVPYITVEEYFIFSFTFMLNLFFYAL